MKCTKESLFYRKMDGSCNNLQNFDWGMTGVNFNRWLKATYTDGNYSSCCEKDRKYRHPSCMRINIAEDDPLYGPLNVTCKGFLRSPPFTGRCPGRREQQNRMTSYIDASDMYGASHEEGKRLRTRKKGLMRHSIVHDTTLLPESKDSGNACYAKHANYSCFLSGDIRVNLLMPLMTVHTMWLREHNRLASELSQINPQWDDETLYQESRKITIAEYQHITYKEFLPIIFGSQRMKELGLLIEEDKTYNGYDENTDAGIHNAFASAAFRFGHTLVQSNVQLRDENYDIKSEIPLHDTYMNPSVLYNRGFDDVVRGMVAQKALEPGHFTSEEIRGRLLQRYFMTNGYDLTAMSILRGRDHGIPSYLNWRGFCKLPVPNSWEDMKNFMENDYVETLQEAYRSIEDIDLIPGAIGEKHLEGALLGPTYICLLGKQFSNLRKGDRFWFENLNHPGAFTKDQLKEIYKISHARIICDNSDDIHKVTMNPFFTPSDENPLLDCDEIPKIDLNHWKEMCQHPNLDNQISPSYITADDFNIKHLVLGCPTSLLTHRYRKRRLTALNVSCFSNGADEILT
ncbi:Peroxidasin like protein [Argiope bruennichi]|uniref:Peroxidasin like protein n=1 Tax=Argiope bruennichi TaxID=94029 RepID=A0A8T0F423_ARGBR|nr:Peroxidasin like protein [Argiope bruennichi]